MSGYIGPLPVPQGIQRKQSFTATASQTTFNTNGYTDGNFINVYLNGVRLINGTDYTATNGSDIVLTTGASASDVLDFETFDTFELVNQTFDNVTLKNPTHEDTDGGRESAVSFKGEQSGGEISTLAQIQASHDGTSDDQKGDLIFKTNDGSDNDAPTERMRIDSDGRVTITRADNGTHLLLESTDADASVGPVLDLYRNSASPADSDIMGNINYKAENSAGETITYVNMIGLLGDVTDGTEDGQLRIQTMTAGSNVNRISINTTETVINDTSKDLDFRVESDNLDDAFFVQGSDGNVGIGTSSPNSSLEVSKTGASATANFEIASLTADFGSATTNDQFGGYLSFRHRTGGNILVEPARIGIVGKSNNKADLVFYGNGGTTSFNAPTELLRLVHGGGITFNGDTAGANALDDYEEGTFTPTLNNGGSPSFSDQGGTYTKIGNTVSFTLVVTFGNVSGSSAFEIGALPFTVRSSQPSGSYFAPAATFIEKGFNASGIDDGGVTALIRQGTTIIQLYSHQASTGSNISQIHYGNLNSSSTNTVNRVRISGVYQTD